MGSRREKAVRLKLSLNMAHLLSGFLKSCMDSGEEFGESDRGPLHFVTLANALDIAITAAEPVPLKLPATISIGDSKYVLSQVTRRRARSAREFKLLSADDNSYYVALTYVGFVTCSCPDYVYNHAGTHNLCKHGKELQKLNLL
jgi:hypothetical protein